MVGKCSVYQSDELYDVNAKNDVHGIADVVNRSCQKVVRLVLWIKQMF